MIEPYYQSDDGRVKLFCGDCLQVMRELPEGCVDAVIADPPYGIADVWKGGSSCGWGVASLATPKRNEWDVKPSAEVFAHIHRIGKQVVIWGGNYFELPISRGWLVWNKPERGFTLSEAELAWTSRDMPMRVFDCHRSDPDREHPTQKPLALMEWCLDQMKLPARSLVLDPFMGSGTTGVACVKTGRRFIGIEIDEGYCAIAKKRIVKALEQSSIFDADFMADSSIKPKSKPRQTTIFDLME